VRTFNSLPDHGPYGPDLEIAFVPKRIPETRHRLIEAGLDMIMLLTASPRVAHDYGEEGSRGL
jgi:hypothetical protein